MEINQPTDAHEDIDKYDTTNPTHPNIKTFKEYVIQIFPMQINLTQSIADRRLYA